MWLLCLLFMLHYICLTYNVSFYYLIIQVTVPTELTALMSAERLGEEPLSGTQLGPGGKKLCRFQQKTPIPSYLIALVVGALDSR